MIAVRVVVFVKNLVRGLTIKAVAHIVTRMFVKIV